MKDKTMNSFLVVWRSDGAEFIHSTVTLGGLVDARQMTNDEWVDAASVSEDNYPAEYAPSLAGYELVLVCDWPTTIYNY
jgi:hypothetical protein